MTKPLPPLEVTTREVFPGGGDWRWQWSVEIAGLVTAAFGFASEDEATADGNAFLAQIADQTPTE